MDSPSTMPMEGEVQSPVRSGLLHDGFAQLTIPGGTNHAVDVQSPSNLGQESTDSGVVANLKWRFSDSKTRLVKGGWVREQVVTDLPSSKDISGAQLHLKKGAIRELHWHKVVCQIHPPPVDRGG